MLTVRRHRGPIGHRDERLVKMVGDRYRAMGSARYVCRSERSSGPRLPLAGKTVRLAKMDNKRALVEAPHIKAA